MPDKPGFEIQGTFYPAIDLERWGFLDHQLFRRVSGYTAEEWYTGRGDTRMGNGGAAAVAFKHANAGIPDDQVVGFFSQISPFDVELVGFEASLNGDGDARPPDDTPGTASTESSEKPSATEPAGSTPATTTPTPSGSPVSDTGSTSDPETSAT